MKSKLLFGSALMVLCGVVTPPLCQTTYAAESTAEPVVSRLPLDLARGNLGTQLQVREPNGAVQTDSRAVSALLGADASKSYSLPSGKTSFILSLAKIEVLSHFNFINNGAEGKMTVSVSSTRLPYESADWRKVGSDESFDGSRVVACEFGNMEGRYVKIDFETAKPGAIAGFGLFGAPVISSFRQQAVANLNYVTTPTRTEVAAAGEDRGAFYDYASLSMGAKVVAVSHADSLADAQYMIDGNMSTAFTFSDSDEHPTAVIDLGTRRNVDRVSCVFEAPAGQMDFYLVENAYSQNQSQVSLNYVTPPGVMPVANTETLNYTGQSVLADRKPVGSVTVNGDAGVNRVSVDLHGLSGRFLIAAYHRSGGRRHSGDFKDTGDFKDFKDKNVAVADNPVKVEGISAFGEPPTAQSIPLLPVGPARRGQNGARPPTDPPNDNDVSP